MPTKSQLENVDKLIQLAIEWERLRSPKGVDGDRR
jgi:hypothetical protein